MWWQPILSAAIALLLSGCAALSSPTFGPGEIPDFVLPERRLSAADPSILPEDLALLALRPEMQRFVQRHTTGLPTKRQRLFALHEAIRGAGALDLDYDVDFTGTAAEAFTLRRANCLSYAHLLVAMARDAGLTAYYQEVALRPNWSRRGDTALIGQHVNVVLPLPSGEQLIADLDPLSPNEVNGTRRLSDREAAALHHSNIAVDAMTAGDLVLAYRQLVKAIGLAPQMPHLWLNLGSTLRRNGQLDDAERVYRLVLAMDARQSSAMNNLVLLNELRGDEAAADYWQRRMLAQRERDPHYHAWLGNQAQQRGDLQKALQHYHTALALRSDVASLHFDIAGIYLAMGDEQRGRSHWQRAQRLADSPYERELYRWTAIELVQSDSAP